jgi:hypothetical protein
MEKIILDDKNIIYKKVFEQSLIKEETLDIVLKIISNKKEEKDAYPYDGDELNYFFNLGVEMCIEVANIEDKKYTEFKKGFWINRVKTNNIKQLTHKGDILEFHNHVEINERMGRFKPTYTFVYYLQMPNNLEGDDGCLFFKKNNGEVYKLLPQEGDLIVMPGDISHAPNKSPNSTKDRIVFAGNVGLQNIKKIKSFI